MGIIESVQQYDLNIPAGGAQAIDVAGDRVQFLSAVDPFAQIEIRPNFAQGNISLKPGQGFKFSEQVTRWVVFNKGSVALSGYLLIGSGDFFDQRISGDVNVIDSAVSRTLANLAFMGSGYRSAVAAQYAQVQLWNPAGSGKNVVLESYLAGGTNAEAPNIYAATAPISSLTGNGQPKLIGGTPAVAEVRTFSGASPAGAAMAILYTQASSTQGFTLKEPIVLRPGYGLTIVSSYGIDLIAQFEWYEQ